MAVVLFRVWKWNSIVAGAVLGLFFLVDTAYFASNLTKIADGGWFPLTVAAVVFTVLTTWATGRALLRRRLAETTLPLSVFIKSTAGSLHRVRGTSVFMASSAESLPSALLHNIKHNQVLHERVVILTVLIEEVPYYSPEKRSEVMAEGEGFYRVVLKYGFMDEIDVPGDLARADVPGGPFSMMTTSFFLGRQKLIASKRPGMALWREQLFAWMTKNSESAMEFFGLPTNRVVELGSQLEI
jgi:KUP system potassium uptake protein